LSVIKREYRSLQHQSIVSHAGCPDLARIIRLENNWNRSCCLHGRVGHVAPDDRRHGMHCKRGTDGALLLEIIAGLSYRFQEFGLSASAVAHLRVVRHWRIMA
jgi:hypothetical protein